MLFSGRMVQALLDDQKTQTRRLLKTNVNLLQPGFTLEGVSRLGDTTNGYNTCAVFRWNGNPPNSEVHLVKSKYQVGDIIWVRETFLDQEDFPCSDYDREDPESGPRYIYKTDCPPEGQKALFWTPSIHMPKQACRIWLEIVAIRVERLNDISEADAWLEGCKKGEPTDNGGFFPAEEPDADGTSERGWDSAKDWYIDLWDQINGDNSWEENPYVWVVEFKRTECPVDFLETQQVHELSQ